MNLVHGLAVVLSVVLALALGTSPARAEPSAAAQPAFDLKRELKVGDLVFIRIDAKPFREVARATGSWTNHVGIVVDTTGPEPTIGESRFPFSGTTPLSRFVARSEHGRIAVMRLKDEPTAPQQAAIAAAAARRAHVFYDTGFDLDSRRQFCSRYVREVLLESTGAAVGEVETFSHLLTRQPDAPLGFWKFWYFGQIPWERRTVTPASVMRSDALRPVFDGTAGR